jgi:hypothetical protein
VIYALQQLPTCSVAPQDAAPPGTDVSVHHADGQAATSSTAATPHDSTKKATAKASAKLLALHGPVPEAAALQLRQHAVVVLEAVQEMLEAVSTPPALLGPLLQVLLEALRVDVGVVTGG